MHQLMIQQLAVHFLFIDKLRLSFDVARQLSPQGLHSVSDIYARTLIEFHAAGWKLEAPTSIEISSLKIFARLNRIRYSLIELYC